MTEWHDLEQTFDELSFLELSRQPGAVVRRLEWSYERLITRASGESLWGAVLYSQASLLIGRTEPAKQVWSVVNANQALLAAVKRTRLLHLTYCIVTGAALRRRGDSASAAMLLGTAVEIAAKEPTLSPVFRAHAFRHAGVFNLWPGLDDPADSELTLVLLNMARTVLSGGAEEPDGQTGADASEELLNIDKFIAIAQSAKDPAGSMQSLLDIAREAREAGHLRTAAWCDFNALQVAAQNDL